MAQRGAPAGWDSPADRPSVLQITVESAPRRRPAVRRAHVVVAIVVLGAIAAAGAIAVLPGGGGGSAPPPTPNRLTPAPQQPSVVVQSVSPLGTAPGLDRIQPECQGSVGAAQTGPCSPQDGRLSVVLRRVGHSWRGVLISRSATCSPVPVPPLARGKVKACRR